MLGSLQCTGSFLAFVSTPQVGYKCTVGHPADKLRFRWICGNVHEKRSQVMIVTKMKLLKIRHKCFPSIDYG